MKKRLVASFVAVLLGTPAFAQEGPPVALPQTSTSQIDELVPSQPASPYKVVTEKPAMNFPVLPAARSCKKDDIYGFWQLTKMFQHNTDGTSQDFKVNPNQIFVLDPLGTYKENKFNQPIQPSDGSLYQFVLTDTGLIYFYTNGQVTHSKMCFIVARAQGDIGEGYMMLMPPMPSDGSIPVSRTVSFYKLMTKLKVPAAQAAEVTPNAPTAPVPAAAAPAVVAPATPADIPTIAPDTTMPPTTAPVAPATLPPTTPTTR